MCCYNSSRANCKPQNPDKGKGKREKERKENRRDLIFDKLINLSTTPPSSSLLSTNITHSHFIKCTNCVPNLRKDTMLSQVSHQVCCCQNKKVATNITPGDDDSHKNSSMILNTINSPKLYCSTFTLSPSIAMDHLSLNHRLIHCPCHSSQFSLLKSDSSSHTNRTLRSSSSHSGWRPILHLLFGLLLLSYFPNAMSSPVRLQGGSSSSSSTSTDTAEHIRHHQRPSKWINPCRMPNHPGGHSAHPGEFEVQQQSDADIFENIIMQVIKAEHQAKEFMGAFFTESFGIEPQYENDKYRDIHYDWLEPVAEIVGKYLGEDVDPDKLAELNVGDTLLAMYEGLQKFAVGLEQVVLDQAVYGGSFHQNFHEAEFQLKYVLCELQIAMMEKNIVNTDITREIMSQKHRDLENKATRSIRDWLIFRDYVTTLEFMRHTFKFFLSKTNKDQ